VSATRTVTALRDVRGGVAVFLDGARWRVVPVAARAELRVGAALDRETARLLARELRRAKALSQATRLLATSDRSRRGLEERLEQKGHSPAARAEALAALERAGLLDDDRVARDRAVTLAERGYGDAAIRADLLRRRVSAELAAEAVGALEPESERVRRLIERETPSPRLLRRLASRGFSHATLEELAAAVFADRT
jgi:SOS response regulatory protein OraA/RecX